MPDIKGAWSRVAIGGAGRTRPSFPTRPIRVLVAFPPGGPTDFVGRLIAEKMKAVLGQMHQAD